MAVVASSAVFTRAVAVIGVLPLRADLRALTAVATTPNRPTTYYVAGRLARGDGFEGVFEWVDGDQSANVTADPLGGVWLSVTADATGATGAFKRVILDNVYHSKWFGDPGETNHTPSIQGCVNLAPEGSTIDTGPTRVNIGAGTVAGFGVVITKSGITLKSRYKITAPTAITAYFIGASVGASTPLTLSGSTIPPGTTSIDVTDASSVIAGNLIELFSADVLATAGRLKGELMQVRSVAGNTITFTSATLFNLTTGITVSDINPVTNVTAHIDVTSEVASTVLHTGVRMQWCVNARAYASGLNVYNSVVTAISCINMHIDYTGGNPGALTSNGFDYGVAIGNGCKNVFVQANGHDHRHVVTAGGTTMVGANMVFRVRGYNPKDAVVDLHTGFINADVEFQAIDNRTGGTPAAGSVSGVTIQCGGHVRIKGHVKGGNSGAVFIQPFQDTVDSFDVDVTMDNAAATAVRAVNFDIRKIGGSIEYINLRAPGADAGGTNAWGIGINYTANTSTVAFPTRRITIRDSTIDGVQYGLGIQTRAIDVIDQLDIVCNVVTSGTHKVVVNNSGAINRVVFTGNTLTGIDNAQKGFWMVGSGTTQEVAVRNNHFEGMAANTTAIAVHLQQAPAAGFITGSNRLKGITTGTGPNFNDYRPAPNVTAGDYRTNP